MILKNTISSQDKTEIKGVLTLWFKGLIVGKPEYRLVSSNFHQEDGMSKDRYLAYELNHFKRLSAIFELNENIKVEILNSKKLKKANCFEHVAYVYNSLGRLAFKMTITTECLGGSWFIGSNDAMAQIVPKYEITTLKNGDLNVSLSIAIQSTYEIKSVTSPHLELMSFGEALNHQSDGFYYAKFRSEEIKQFTSYAFYLSLIKEGKVVVDKRLVFFDGFDISDKPYEIVGDRLKIKDDKYPVHLAVLSDGRNFEYPRGVELRAVKDFVVTDSKDNDWRGTV